ncbi:MAG: type II toxin-antitoxin system RelE family toxin [Candidatus Entotheonellia bacterium]
MAKDPGHVLRVLQILSEEDQETLAILHNPPVMEEVLRRQETLRDVRAIGLSGGVSELLTGHDLPEQALSALRVFPAVVEELAALPPSAQEMFLRAHLPALVAAPREGLALTQLFQGLWVSICRADEGEYRIVYEIDAREPMVTLLMIGSWESLESRLGDTTSRMEDRE